jgi:hypothetical protein
MIYNNVNLEFRKKIRDFSFFLRPTIFLQAWSLLLGKLEGSFFYLCFGYNYNVFFAFWSSLNEVNFVFVQIFALQSVLKLFFLLVVLNTNCGNATKLFIIIYLFFLKESGRLFAKLFESD